MNESKLTELMATFRDDIEKIVKSAWTDGYNEGLSITLPTQEAFDEAHSTAMGYGEEDDWVVVSAALYNEDEAALKIKEYFIQNGVFADSDEELDLIIDTLELRWVGYKINPSEGEASWWLPGKGENLPTFWQAWVVTTS